MANHSGALQGKHILLVDDERSVREILLELLKLDGHTVTEANNGAEALSLFARQRFDLVMTDCVMPFVPGVEFAARVKQLCPSQPILMITGYDMNPSQKNPADKILRKPFDLAQLRTAVAEVLSSPVSIAS
jgi:CheY-like chemotaxis protein